MVRYCCAELISIHAPRTGSDCKSRSKRLSKRTFQSTLPARGATDPLTNVAISCGSISIHAPRTGSDWAKRWTACGLHGNFNPRSPHGERRIHTSAHLQANSKFQSTLPARGATTKHMAHRRKFPYFNPRSPHGERPIVRVGDAISNAISIHAPRTGSDAIDAVYCHVGNISIHAPSTGSDGL